MSICTFDNTAALPHILDALHRDGAVILTDLVSPDTVDAVNSELEPYATRTPFGEGMFWGRRTRRLGGILARSKASQTLCLNQTLLRVVRAVLEPYCTSIQVNGTQLIDIYPDEPEQLLHADEELWPAERNRAEYMVNTVWALSDFTEENGATRIVPGSHRGPIDRFPSEDRVIQATMPKGAVAVWLGSTVHGGGANRSKAPRSGLSIAYSLGWLRQAENQYLAIPPDVARTLPPELQALIGYSVHTPNLGIYEGQDPRDLLRTETRPEPLPYRDFLPQWASEALAAHCENAAEKAA